MPLTSHAKTVDALLRQQFSVTLEEFITRKRADGLSYFQISRKLAALTGGAVDVTGETIRNWLNDLAAVA